MCSELFFCEKAHLFHFRQISLYTAITWAPAAENYLQVVVFLNNDPHNEM